MAHKEIAAFEDLATQIFDFAESFPRLADLGVEPLRGAPGERGALLLQGPLKMLQTVVMVTVNGKAQGVADRFKALLSRSKWVAADAVDGALAGSFTPQPTRPWMSGAEGLKAARARPGHPVRPAARRRGSLRGRHRFSGRAGPRLRALRAGALVQ